MKNSQYLGIRRHARCPDHRSPLGHTVVLQSPGCQSCCPWLVTIVCSLLTPPAHRFPLGWHAHTLLPLTGGAAVTPLWVPSAYQPSVPAVVTFRDADLSSLFCLSPCMLHGVLSAYHARVEGAPQPRHLGRGNSSVYEGPCCPCRRSPVPVPNTPVIIPVLWAGTGGVSLGHMLSPPTWLQSERNPATRV